MDKNTVCYGEVRSLFVGGNIPWWCAFQDGHVIGLFNEYEKVAEYESQKGVDVRMMPMKTNMKTESSPEWKTKRQAVITNCHRILGYTASNQGNINKKGWIEVYLLYNMQNPDMFFDFPKYWKVFCDKNDELAQSMKKDSSLGTSVIIQHMAPQFMSKMKSIIQAKPRYNLRPRKPVNYVY